MNALCGCGQDLWVGQGINDSLSEVVASGIATHVRGPNLLGRMVIILWPRPHPDNPTTSPSIHSSLRKPASGRPRHCLGKPLWSTV